MSRSGKKVQIRQKGVLVVTCDVDTANASGQKRLRKVAKICERYGMRVQNSVFEVLLDAAQLVVLKHELEKIIDTEQDSVRFYRLGNSYERSRSSTYFLTPTLPVHIFPGGSCSPNKVIVKVFK